MIMTYLLQLVKPLRCRMSNGAFIKTGPALEMPMFSHLTEMDVPRAKDQNHPTVRRFFDLYHQLRSDMAVLKVAGDDPERFNNALVAFGNTIHDLNRLIEGSHSDIVEFWTGGDCMFLMTKWFMLKDSQIDYDREIAEVGAYNPQGAEYLRQLQQQLNGGAK